MKKIFKYLNFKWRKSNMVWLLCAVMLIKLYSTNFSQRSQLPGRTNTSPLNLKLKNNGMNSRIGERSRQILLIMFYREKGYLTSTNTSVAKEMNLNSFEKLLFGPKFEISFEENTKYVLTYTKQPGELFQIINNLVDESKAENVVYLDVEDFVKRDEYARSRYTEFLHGMLAENCFFWTEELLLGGVKSGVQCLSKCLATAVSFIHNGNDIFERCKNCFQPKYLTESTFGGINSDFKVYSFCQRFNQSSMCENYITNENEDGNYSGLLQKDTHIAYAADKNQFIGLSASINSVIKSSKSKEKIFFHVFVCADCKYDINKKLNTLAQTVTAAGANIEIHQFYSKEVHPFINVHLVERKDLKSPNNYIRYLIAAKLPSVSSCIWMDSDTIVLKDVVDFMGTVQNRHVVAGFSLFTMSTLGGKVFKSFASLGVNVSTKYLPRFHAGVIVINLDQWREKNITEAILKISNLNKKYTMYTKLGSQAPLTLLFSGDDFEHLNPNLYAGNLGWDREASIPCDAVILHWNGNKKPWLVNAISSYKKLWSNSTVSKHNTN